MNYDCRGLGVEVSECVEGLLELFRVGSVRINSVQSPTLEQGYTRTELH